MIHMLKPGELEMNRESMVQREETFIKISARGIRINAKAYAMITKRIKVQEVVSIGYDVEEKALYIVQPQEDYEQFGLWTDGSRRRINSRAMARNIMQQMGREKGDVIKLLYSRRLSTVNSCAFVIDQGERRKRGRPRKIR